MTSKAPAQLLAGRLWRAARWCLAVALLSGPQLAARADDGNPPQAWAERPAAPASSAAASASCQGSDLYCQLEPPGTSIVSAQDFAGDYNAFDSWGADDFVISSAGDVKSWEITAVSVAGEHLPSDSSATTSVLVRFYSDLGGLRPATLLITRTASISPTTLASGDFYLPLSPPVTLAADGAYWLSVQAVKPPGSPPPQWLWATRAGQAHQPAVWQNPGLGFGIGCASWQPLAACFDVVGEDLAFSLIGSASTETTAAPLLTQMLPPGGYNQDTQLNLKGANFAPGAVISWTVLGEDVPFTVMADFASATDLTAAIPAAQLSDLGNKARVVVVNPAPCAGLCASNPLTFTIDTLNSVYLPTIRR